MSRITHVPAADLYLDGTARVRRALPVHCRETWTKAAKTSRGNKTQRRTSHVTRHTSHLQQQCQTSTGNVDLSDANAAPVGDANQGIDSRNAAVHVAAVRAIDDVRQTFHAA
jgi:hypothetical protein